jgi:hypothetical protein
MNRKATQIYLSDAQHTALQREADRTGSSITAVIRDLVDRYLLAAAPVTDLTDLAGVISTPRPTDIAVDKDRLLYEDLRDDLRRHERPVRVAES